MRFLLALGRRRLIVALLCLLCIFVLLGAGAWWRSPDRGLPWRDSFAYGNADEWRAFGGTWELFDGMMRNDSDERGAKLVTGSSHWSNYSIEADVSLLGTSGDAGLIIRSSDEEEGVNAYSGYYAGVRTIDNSLVIGRADHGWAETTKEIPETHSIRPFRWYHLKLIAYGCQIAAAVTIPSEPAPVSIGFTDPICVHSGRAGLRSYSSGGIWKNIVVQPATHQDLIAMLDNPKSMQRPPEGNLIDQDSGFVASRQFVEEEQAGAGSAAVTQTIASLRLDSFAVPTQATIRGVVILTTPRLYVQDSTGGLYIPHPKAPLLKVGDEVEVSGMVYPGDFSSTMEDATVQVLWARAPLPPVSVTASQAATGKYDATFIEVHGRLVGKQRGPGNTLILGLDEGPQSFRAVMNPGRSDSLFDKLKLNSILSLRGICVVDPQQTHNITPFVLLLRSNEDLSIISGPPWWNTEHVLAIGAVVFLLAILAILLYHSIQSWRLRTVLDERGRLAHEMHDTLAQSFAGIGFQLQAIRNALPQGMPALDRQLELASDLVRHSHEETRRSIASLRSESFEPEDILAALGDCAHRLIGSASVQVVLEKEGEQRTVPLQTADALYRIGQEAIANSIRHANPGSLAVRLTYRENLVSLEIEDDGRGFSSSTYQSGFGIRGMRRRAQAVSAAFQIVSQPGYGTLVRTEAPLPPRVTFASWPKLFWKYTTVSRINVRTSGKANSHPYRR